jgi:hypothetical protein
MVVQVGLIYIVTEVAGWEEVAVLAGVRELCQVVGVTVLIITVLAVPERQAE